MFYSDIIIQAAIRCSAVKGATEAVRITNMAVNPLTSTQIGSVDFPFPIIQKQVLSGVGRIIRTYSGLKTHPFRDYNTSQTSALATGAAIPTVNSASKKVIGLPGAVKDASDGTILTRQPKQIIDSINRSLADGSRVGSVYFYEFVDGRIIHTRTTVTIDVCTFDLPTETTAIATASGVCPLPDACLDLAWAAALAGMMTDDAYVSQAQVYEGYVRGELNAMAQGATNFSPPPDVTISK